MSRLDLKRNSKSEISSFHSFNPFFPMTRTTRPKKSKFVCDLHSAQPERIRRKKCNRSTHARDFNIAKRQLWEAGGQKCIFSKSFHLIIVVDFGYVLIMFNYRDIAVSSSLCKLFCSVLNNSYPNSRSKIH